MPQAAKKQKTEDGAVESKKAEEAEETPKREEAPKSGEAPTSEEPPKSEEAPKSEEPPKSEDAAMEEAAEPEKEKELEEDAPKDTRATVKGIQFHTQDTTLNVMPSSFGNMLVPISEAGFQYLMAGARADVGVKAGRYMFEVKMIEFLNPADEPSAKMRAPQPKHQLRLGFSTATSELFLGETETSVCFDAQGQLIHNKQKEAVSEGFARDEVVAVVLNLDAASPNANTISLFKNGVRVSKPQPLPESLKGKTLYPTLTFKNVTVTYNFGPEPYAPLPFKCKMMSQAAQKDAEVKTYKEAVKGKYEVLFPVCLPDEGTFDWLDMFLEKNPQYHEISDRMVLRWAEMSGLKRNKAFATRGCNDKPEMGFQIQQLDDLSVSRLLSIFAPLHHRHYVVMEVKANLLKEDRAELMTRWKLGPYKLIAVVMMETPPAEFKEYSQKLALQQKQEASDELFKIKKADEKRKKEVEMRAQQAEKARKKAFAQAERKRKMAEYERKKKVAEEKKKKAEAEGKEFDEEMPEPPEEEEAKEEEEPEKKIEENNEEPPQVTLDDEEKQRVFRNKPSQDLTSYAMSTTFVKFSLPEKEEGFDEVRFDWAKEAACKQYMRSWVSERKLTTRVEDLVPGEWFHIRWREWQKELQSWHSKQNAHKSALAKKAQEKAQKDAKKAAKKAEKEAKAKAAEEKAKKAAEEGEDAEMKEGEEKKEDEEKEEEPEEEEEEEEDKEQEAKELHKLDIFGIEDIHSVNGEPLYSRFGFEDWTLMGLRFEVHLLAHAFRKDVNDPDRVGIYVDHLQFYYNKYFKKALNLKFYGVDTVKELLEFVRDTVVMTPTQSVIEPQLPEDLEGFNIFAMLTEESRRDRSRRVDLGEESAKLKIQQPGTPMLAQAGITRPAGVPGIVRPFQATPLVRPATTVFPAGAAAWAGTRPAQPLNTAGFRPPGAFAASTRPAQPLHTTALRPPSAFFAGTRPAQPLNTAALRPPGAIAVRAPFTVPAWRAVQR